jgi:hypothetical protein
MKSKTVLLVLAALGVWYVVSKTANEAAVLTKSNALPPDVIQGAGDTYPRGELGV